MSGQSCLAMPGNLIEYRASERATGTLRAAIASRLAELRSAWERQASRRRLARSIAHLEDRLLADIGLGPEDLGFSERHARSRATHGLWAGSKAGPGTDWQ
jgi:uncharacterized protein YjiS (DUF1127 family)